MNKPLWYRLLELFNMVNKLLRGLAKPMKQRLTEMQLNFEEIDFDELEEVLGEYGDIRPEIAKAVRTQFRGFRARIDAEGAADYLEQWEHLPHLLRAVARCIEADLHQFGDIIDKHLED